MTTFVGYSLSAGSSRRSVLSERAVECDFGGRAGDVNSLVTGTRTRWKGYGVCVVRGAALDVRCRGSWGRGSPGHMYARDRVVNFGKNKGSMLGTLSSRYLRWMTKNLKGTVLDDWADYAEETLNDPLYMDRIEWEIVEKYLVQSHDLAQVSNIRGALAPARMYGWDIDNVFAWSEVNFALLGTTKGGKIPRVPSVKGPRTKPKTKSEPNEKSASARMSKLFETVVNAWLRQGKSKWASTSVVEEGSLREELDRRRQARRERLTAQRDALLAGSKNMKVMDIKFPGRGGLRSKLQENPKK